MKSAGIWSDPVGFAIGAVLVLASIYFGLGALRDWRDLPGNPLQLSVDDAVRASSEGHRWVEVTGVWNCNLATPQDSYTWVPTAASDGTLVVARFRGIQDCGAATAGSVRGVIEAMPSGVAANLTAIGLLHGASSGLRLFNVGEDGGPEDARLGVIVCTLGLLLGAGFVPLRRGIATWRDRGFTRPISSVSASSLSEAQDRRLAGRDAVLWGLAFGGAAGASGLINWLLAPAGGTYWIPFGPCLLGATLAVFGVAQWRTGRQLAFARRFAPNRYTLLLAATLVLALVGWPRLVDTVWPR